MVTSLSASENTSVHCRDLPDHALLAAHRNRGDYTDCFSVDFCGAISLADYINAFYTTAPFKAERIILKLLISKPSTDDEARRLASAGIDKFAAWHVSARSDDQLLMCDYRGSTCHWLMTEQIDVGDSATTRLYFGSAIVAHEDKKTGAKRIGSSFRALLWFHKVYSRVLLGAAKRKLQSGGWPTT